MKIDPAPNPSERPPSLHRHWEMLGAAASVLVLAFLLRVRPDERVAFRGLSAYPIPHTCASRAWFGVDCPACGLTRSMIHLARGDWSASTRAHRLGPLIAAAILIQVPYRLYALRRRDPAPLGRFLPTLFGYFLIIALIGNWLDNQRTAARPATREAQPVGFRPSPSSGP